jgi:hypothetical protein
MPYGEIEWSRAPRAARWWAIDADGAAHWFAEPNIGHDNDFWYAERIAAPDFGYSGNYRDSLTPRPDRRKRRTRAAVEAAE